MIRYLQKLKAKKGFTLVELLVVIAIIGILAAVLVPLMSTFLNNARVSNANQAARNAKTVMDTWILAEQTANSTTRGIVSGTATTDLRVVMAATQAAITVTGTAADWKGGAVPTARLQAIFFESFQNAPAGSIFVVRFSAAASDYQCTIAIYADANNTGATTALGADATSAITAYGTLIGGRINGNGAIVGSYPTT